MTKFNILKTIHLDFNEGDPKDPYYSYFLPNCLSHLEIEDNTISII